MIAKMTSMTKLKKATFSSACSKSRWHGHEHLPPPQHSHTRALVHVLIAAMTAYADGQPRRHGGGHSPHQHQHGVILPEHSDQPGSPEQPEHLGRTTEAAFSLEIRRRGRATIAG